MAGDREPGEWLASTSRGRRRFRRTARLISTRPSLIEHLQALDASGMYTASSMSNPSIGALRFHDADDTRKRRPPMRNFLAERIVRTVQLVAHLAAEHRRRHAVRGDRPAAGIPPSANVERIHTSGHAWDWWRSRAFAANVRYLRFPRYPAPMPVDARLRIRHSRFNASASSSDSGLISGQRQVAAAECLGPARRDRDNVRAELCKFCEHIVLHAFTDRRQQDDGGDANADAEGREPAAQPVRAGRSAA